MAVARSVSDVLFWIFPILLMSLGIATLWVWLVEKELLELLARQHRDLFANLGRPTTRMHWFGIAALTSNRRKQVRESAATNKVLLSVLQNYEQSIRWRRIAIGALVLCWIGLMLPLLI